MVVTLICAIGVALAVLARAVIYLFKNVERETKQPTEKYQPKRKLVYSFDTRTGDYEFLLNHTSNWVKVGEREATIATSARVDLYHLEEDILLADCSKLAWDAYEEIQKQKQKADEAYKKELEQAGITPLDDYYKILTEIHKQQEMS